MSFTPKDLVWYNEGDNIQSGGYSVDSLFKTLGISPITTENVNMTGGGNKGSNSEIHNVKMSQIYLKQQQFLLV